MMVIDFKKAWQKIILGVLFQEITVEQSNVMLLVFSVCEALAQPGAFSTQPVKASLYGTSCSAGLPCYQSDLSVTRAGVATGTETREDHLWVKTHT